MKLSELLFFMVLSFLCGLPVGMIFGVRRSAFRFVIMGIENGYVELKDNVYIWKNFNKKEEVIDAKSE